MAQLKEKGRRFRRLYWQQFFLTAGMVLLALLLLGASFYALSYNYTLKEKRNEMTDRARLIAKMSAPFLTREDGEEIDREGTLRNLAGVASLMSDANFLICDDQGRVLLTSDESLVGRSVTVPDDILTEILRGDGSYEGRTTVGNIYESKQFVTGASRCGSAF